MSSRPSVVRSLVGFMLVASACAPSPEPTPTALPTETATPRSGILPPGCESITLRSPTGEIVNLDGEWVQDVPLESRPMTWWWRDHGDCVSAAGSADLATIPAPGPWHVQSFSGRMTPDFHIDGEAVLLGPPAFGEEAVSWAAVRFLIEFDDTGEVILREDREPGVQGPRCPAPQGAYCPDPLVLVRP